MATDDAAYATALVSPDRVRFVIEAALRTAQFNGWSDKALEQASGVKARCIKSYRLEGKEPSLSHALSLAVALGPQALNTVLGLIGYVARPLEEGDEIRPMRIVADGLSQFNVIAQAAADGRFDHTEREPCRVAADEIIAIMTPLSSAGRAE